MLIQFFVWLFILFWAEKLRLELLSLFVIIGRKFVYHVVTSRNLIDLFYLLLGLLVA